MTEVVAAGGAEAVAAGGAKVVAAGGAKVVAAGGAEVVAAGGADIAIAGGAEIVIAGGGLAGAACACLLARAGRRVLLLERATTATHKVCGEFLNTAAQRYLRALDLDPAALGGHRIATLRLVRGKHTVEARLPSPGMGLSRFRLDEALLAHAAASGATIARGHAITAARIEAAPGHPTGPPIALQIAGRPDLRTPTLFLATGKHDLRGLRRHPTRTPEDLVAFKCHVHLAPDQTRALAGHVEIVMFPDGYAGLQPIEGGQANLCLLTSRARVHRCAGQWEMVLANLRADSPHLHRRLDGASRLPARAATAYRVPYGFVHAPSATDPPGVFRLGDQMGVIPSFAGEGMSIALHSASVAVRHYLKGLPASTYHRQMQRDIAGPIGRASALYRFARYPAGQTLLMALVRAWPGSTAIAARLLTLASGDRDR